MSSAAGVLLSYGDSGGSPLPGPSIVGTFTNVDNLKFYIPATLTPMISIAVAKVKIDSLGETQYQDFPEGAIWPPTIPEVDGELFYDYDWGSSTAAWINKIPDNYSESNGINGFLMFPNAIGLLPGSGVITGRIIPAWASFFQVAGDYTITFTPYVGGNVQRTTDGPTYYNGELINVGGIAGAPLALSGTWKYSDHGTIIWNEFEYSYTVASKTLTITKFWYDDDFYPYS
jgi:hypothetical protein